MTIKDYLDLITSAFRQKEKFQAVITANTAIQLRVQELLNQMLTIFDLDNAVGDQLDIIGKWVGMSRNVSVPIPNVYFSWDGASSLGWEYGTWQPTTAPTTVTTLPDDAFKLLIRAKIAANKWDGSLEGAYDVWEAVFPTLNILIQDHQDMSYDLIIVGEIVSSLTQALLVGGYIPLRPEGVKVNNYYLPAGTGPVFGWDLESDYVQGWGEGSWATAVSGS